MQRARILLTVCLAASFLTRTLGAETAAAVIVSGAVTQKLKLTADDLKQFSRTEVTVNDHGKSVRFEGVRLYDVLQKAGAPVGDKLKGKALASYVIVSAKDGYQVVYALPELDPSFTQTRILLADKSDGKPLSGTAGPFRIVAPDDKKMARSIRMVEKIEVIALK